MTYRILLLEYAVIIVGITLLIFVIIDKLNNKKYVTSNNQ